MKVILVAALAVSLSISIPAFARGGHSAAHASPSGHSAKVATGTGAKSSHEHVSGYTKKDGTVVKGHDRSTKDDTTANNWSTKGNTNPETGKAGTK
ncbi:hypothetical protein [Janthinobacterium sp. HH107]|uniref:hypothetical protein n=1 Tax=Janthinobacterium sp. HH107 TaxID=1537279 RepID=UPI0021092B44|nr:hypothetical protein [Janthinobacterium sp. HH107]